MFRLDVAESSNQFVALGRLVANDHPGSEQFVRNGLAVCWSASELAFNNVLFLSHRVAGVETLKQCFGEAAGYMRSKPHPGVFFLCEDYIDEPARAEIDVVACDVGMMVVTEMYGMVGDLLPFDRSASHPDLRFRRVTDDEALRHFADINSDAYGLSAILMRADFKGSRLWKEQSSTFIGYLEGRPVSTASAFASSGHVYGTYVATRPDVRRRGFAEATLRRALEAAHETTGFRRTSLHATAEALTVYERMGYRRVTRFVGYGFPEHIA